MKVSSLRRYKMSTPTKILLAKGAGRAVERRSIEDTLRTCLHCP